jgi:hypothetical protein
MILLTNLLNEIDNKYKIYVDMDGVLVDFVNGYEKFTGKKLGGFTHGQANKDFWNDFKQVASDKGVSETDFWANLKWLPDGKQLLTYLKSHSPTILSAPGRNPESKEGKQIWIKREMGNIPYILAYDKSKYATSDSILIDDREDFISKWKAKGGIGILHKSTNDTISQLKKLGI